MSVVKSTGKNGLAQNYILRNTITHEKELARCVGACFPVQQHSEAGLGGRLEPIINKLAPQ